MKEFFSKMVVKTTRTFYKAKRVIGAHSPEILIVTGTVAVIGGVVLACKETLHLEEIISDHENTMYKINEQKRIVDGYPQNRAEYTDKMVTHDKIVTITKTTGKIIRLYAPATSTLVFGMGCMIGAYGIMKKRNIALMAAYKALEAQFNEYRRRVIEKDGEEADFEFRNGLKKSDTDVDNSDIKKNDLISIDGHDASMYAKFFDESNPHYVKDADMNLTFINSMEQLANHRLHSKGFLLLNDVYDMLGIPRTCAGAHVGWLSKEYGGKDGYVDFCIKQVWRNPAMNEARRNFLEGYERSVFLDFNVDGVVVDKIDSINFGKKEKCNYAMA